MKILAVNLQDQNWDDDGGDHDVFLIQVEDDVAEDIANLDEDECLSTDSALHKIITDSAMDLPYSFPISIDGVYSIWTE